jgi:hypothetical protein
VTNCSWTAGVRFPAEAKISLVPTVPIPVRGTYSQRKRLWNVKLTTCLNLVPRLTMRVGATSPFLVHIYGVVFISAGTNISLNFPINFIICFTYETAGIFRLNYLSNITLLHSCKLNISYWLPAEMNPGNWFLILQLFSIQRVYDPDWSWRLVTADINTFLAKLANRRMHRDRDPCVNWWFGPIWTLWQEEKVLDPWWI